MAQKDFRVIRLNSADNVEVVIDDMRKGEALSTEGTTALNTIPAGHKVATAPIGVGDAVIKYGQVIGTATQPVAAGEHVHTHNLSLQAHEHDCAVGAGAVQNQNVATEPLAIDAIERPDGRIATRNYIGVISTVNCAASVTRMIADSFDELALSEFPNVDGVVPICHGWGCGMAAAGEGFETLRACLAGYARHPNFASVITVGLGCEVMQLEAIGDLRNPGNGSGIKSIAIQQAGGTAATVKEVVERIREILPSVNQIERRPVALKNLSVGLECGGSDAYSGISANPALGVAADLLVAHGATVVLGETPEIYGAEHLLLRRALNSEVAQKLIDRIHWWEAYTARNGGEMDNNPTPGNKAGGLTTIFEKSLGAIAKGGSTNLVDVYSYARPITAKGLVFMDTPGYDPVSLTGMVAGGVNLICFTTGRGSVYGCRPVPSLKLATNTPMYSRMQADMDINCGTIIDGDATVREVGQEIFKTILSTASGQRTKSESLGIGNDEFVPWQMGAIM